MRGAASEPSVADEPDGHRLHVPGLGREVPAPQDRRVGTAVAVRAREQEGGGQQGGEGSREEGGGAPPRQRRERQPPPAGLLDGEDEEGRQPPGEDELRPQPEKECETGPGGPRGGGARARRGEGAPRGGEGEEQEKGREPDRPLVHYERHEPHREDEPGRDDRGGPHAEEPRGKGRPQEEEEGALHARRHRVGEELPERIEGHRGQAADVGVGPQGQGGSGERQAQVEVPTAVADERKLPRPRGARAAEGVVVDELVHVVGDRAGGGPGDGQKQDRRRDQAGLLPSVLHDGARLAAA